MLNRIRFSLTEVHVQNETLLIAQTRLKENAVVVSLRRRDHTADCPPNRLSLALRNTGTDQLLVPKSPPTPTGSCRRHD